MLLLIFASPVRAEPFVRWVDKTGGVKRAAVEEVLLEERARVKLRLVDGAVLDLPVRGLLRLVREDDRDPDQRALLLARLGLELGPVEGVGGLLDRLAAGGKQPWIREYAAASRAIAAERAGEKDAATRLDAFLKEHPGSRLRDQVLLARTRLLAHGITAPEHAVRPFMKVFKELKNSDSSLLTRYGILVDAGLLVAEQSQDDAKGFIDSIAESLYEEFKEDAMAHLIAQSVFMRIKVIMIRRARRHVQKTGQKPVGALLALRQLKLESGFLIDEVRSDLQFEIGVTAQVCGDAAVAKAAFSKSLKLAPDPFRHDRAAKKARPQ